MRQEGLVRSFANGDDVYAEFAQIVFNRSVNKKEQPTERFIGKTRSWAWAMVAARIGFFRWWSPKPPVQYFADGLFDETMAERVIRIYRTLFSPFEVLGTSSTDY